MTTEPVSVVIEGENFLALATQHIDGREPVTMDAHFQAFLGEVALEDVTRVDARTLRARVPGGLATGWHSLSVVGPLGRRAELPRAYFSSDRPLARLEARAALEGGQVSSLEERTWLVLTVRNTGGSAALAVTPVLHSLGEGRGEILSEPGPADIAAGGSASFKWELGAVSPWELHFLLKVRGSESITGAELRAPDVEVGPVWIRQRAVLIASPLASRPMVNVGQVFDGEVEVRNPGDSMVLGVKPQVMGCSGTGRVTLVLGPTPASVDIPGKGRAVFRVRLIGAGEGSCVFRVGAHGVDRTDGTPVVAMAADPSLVLVRRPAVLTATFSAPSRVKRGSTFSVSMKVTNTGSTVALGVSPTLPVSSSGVAVLVAGPGSSTVDVAGGASTTFTWHYRAASPGKVSFAGGAHGRDGNTGGLLPPERFPRARCPSWPRWSNCSPIPSETALPSPRSSATTAVSISAPTGAAPGA